MLTLKLNAKSSTSASLMTKKHFQLFHSSAPTEPSSIRTTSFAIGGSTLNALKLKVSIPWMTKLQLREKSLQLQHLMSSQPTQLPLMPKHLHHILSLKPLWHLPPMLSPKVPQLLLQLPRLIMRKAEKHAPRRLPSLLLSLQSEAFKAIHLTCDVFYWSSHPSSQWTVDMCC